MGERKEEIRLGEVGSTYEFVITSDRARFLVAVIRAAGLSRFCTNGGKHRLST